MSANGPMNNHHCNQYDWPDLDVAIVGGGPAGLATALALLRVQPELRLKVFESNPQYTFQGAGVNISKNGARALEAMDPTALLRLFTGAVHISSLYQYSDVTGERMPWVTTNSPLESLERDGYAMALVSWNSLRETLYHCLPKGTVVFGCKVLECLPPEQGARGLAAAAARGASPPAGAFEPEAAYEPWYTTKMLRTAPGHLEDSEAGRREEVHDSWARARYVIAADGYFSRVRRTAGDGEAPAFRGSVRWLASVTKADLDDRRVPLPAALEVLMDPHNAASGHCWLQTSRNKPLTSYPTRVLMVYPADVDLEEGVKKFVWTLSAPVEALAAAGQAFPCVADGGAGAEDRSSVQLGGRLGRLALQRALKVAAHLPAELWSMLAATPPERAMEFGLYMHDEKTYREGAWARGGLVLLGDAAHAGRADGQGANSALEDAAVLAAMVRRHGLGPEAFRAWEAARLARVRGILFDSTPGASVRGPLIQSASFEPLWCPLQLATAPGSPLPEGVAREVQQAAKDGGEEGVEKGREVVLAWVHSQLRRMVESKVAGRAVPQQVDLPSGSFQLR